MALEVFKARAMAEMGRRNPRAAFDPAIIMVIAEIIMQLVEVLQENCGKDPEEAAQRANDPGRWGKLFVRIRARREMGRRDYREHGADVTASVLAAGKGATAEEMKAAYDELD